MAAADKGAEKGSGRSASRPDPAPAKEAPEPKAEPKADHPGPPIGIEPDIRVGGHIITDKGWTPEEDS